jgi:predicted  nucleic acid-binding Zn-ribbon protein
MLEAIEKLLILQDRDRRLARLEGELASIGPERDQLQAKLTAAQAALDTAKLRVKQLETERKKLELEVAAKQEMIERYSLQQFQTRRNDEYRALTHEIEACKAAIAKLEDQQLELMEQADQAQLEAAAAATALNELKQRVTKQLADLAARQTALEQQLTSAQAERAQAASAVEESLLGRYERLRRSKGQQIIVGVERGVCGGCHVRIPPQVIVTCRAAQEIAQCPNCGRILYYTRDMVLTAEE